MDCRVKPGKDGENWVSIQSEHALSAILDVGLRPIGAERKFGMPFAALVLVFDGLALPRLALLGGNAPRGFKRLLVRGEALREHTVDGVSPAVLVANHLVSHVCHGFTCLAHYQA